MNEDGGGLELAWFLWTIVAALFLIFGVAELVSTRCSVSSFWLIGGLVGTSCSILTGVLSLRGGGAGTADAPRMPEVGFGPVLQKENLDATIAALQHEAAIQAETAAAIDAKLLGLLGFMAAAIGLLLTVGHGLDSYRWILLVGAAGAVFVALVGVISPGDVKAGPDPIDFYKKYAEAEPVAFLNQLFANYRKVLDENKVAIKEREEALSLAFGWAVLAALVFGVVRGLVAILAC